MPVHRLAGCNVLGISSRNSRAGVKLTTRHFTRWQSTGAAGARSGGGVVKKVIIGVGVAGVAAGGAVVYGINYNPVFRNQVNEKIPGFLSWTDKAANVWVDVTDYFNPKPGVPESEKERKLVYEHNKAKSKARLEEVKKSQPTPANTPATSDKKAGDKPEKNEEKRTDSPASADKITTGDKKSETQDKPKSEIAVTSTCVTAAEDKPTHVAEDNTKSESESIVIANSVGGKQDKASKSKDDLTVTSVKTMSSETASPSMPVSVASSLTSPLPSAACPESSDVADHTIQEPNKEKGDVATEAVEVDVARIEEELEQEVVAIQNEEPELDSSQMEMLLDDTHKRFVSDASKVRAAQQGLAEAWEDLYHKLTASNKQGVTEAKAATEAVHAELKAAAGEYDRNSRKLKKLLQSAPAEGFMAKAGEIASDVRVKEAEVDLGMVVVKEAIASASIVEVYREAIQESKDKLQKDLEAASSLIDPERKDSLLLSLNKKVELLDDKLKEAETGHAQKLMLALEVQRRSLEHLAKEKVEHVLKESEANYNSKLGKEINKMSAHYNGMLREQLRLEDKFHAKEMAKALREQAEKLSSEWLSEMGLKLSEQKGFYQTELARAKARLRGLEVMVDGVASAGEKTIHLQTLQNSCATLTSAVNRVNLDCDVTNRYSVETELKSLRQVANNDPFITVVLDSVPSQAMDGAGIQSEMSLKERFVKVKRICKRVALVPETGGGLGMYAISYLQSLLALHAWLPEEVSADTDPSKLHIYNLLHLADARLRKGDLEGAVYFMNHLQGDSKNVAKDWLRDARTCLETKQAIQLIQAYVSANAAVFSAQK